MTENTLQSYLDRSISLAADCRAWTAVPNVEQIMNRLEDARSVVTTASNSERPLVVAFLGGTGVGKSTLFNALLGANHSPTSSGKRVHTRVAHAAVFRDTRPKAAFLEPLTPVWHEHDHADWENVVLIDTPDIDGAIQSNWEVAENVVAYADVVIYVTDHDRYANARPVKKFHDYAAKKLWLFVMTKADLVQDRHELIGYLDESLRKEGFAPDDGCRFFVDLKNNAAKDVTPLAKKILHKLSTEQRLSMDVRMHCGGLLYALERSLLDAVKERARELHGHEVRLNEKVQDVYRDGFRKPLVRQALHAYICDQSWRALAGRVWGPIGLALWFRARMSTISTGFAVSRLLRGGAIGLLAAGGAAAYSAIRGTLPLRRVLDLIGLEFRETIEIIRREEEQVLNTYQLAELIGSNDADSRENANDSSGGGPLATMTVGPVSFNVHNVDLLSQLRKLLRRDELVDVLRFDCERIAEKGASKLSSWKSVLAANFPPVLMGGHVLWRIGEAWLASDYLSLNFFAMAAILFVVSLLPGYFLYSFRIRRLHDEPDVEMLVRSIEQPLATKRLRAVREGLEQLISKLERFRQSVEVEARRAATSTPFASIEVPSSGGNFETDSDAA